MINDFIVRKELSSDYSPTGAITSDFMTFLHIWAEVVCSGTKWF